MPIKIHDLKPAPGSKQDRRRVGPRHRRQGRQDRRPRPQGPGRPQQHQARLRGWPDAADPADARRPKGFKNPFRVEYHVVNLDTLEVFEAGGEVSPETLRARGLVAKRGLVKVLGRGELTRSLTVKAHAFSASAVRAIEAAGGTTEVLPPPVG